MQSTRVQPHKITQPFQLLALWLTSLILLVSAFLTGAGTIQCPSWLPAMFGISAVALTVLVLVMVFLLQTRFRPEMQDDRYYSDWQRRLDAGFGDFKPLGKTPRESGGKDPAHGAPGADSEIEKWRMSRYKESHGLFLIHSWRPSRRSGQKVDIIIQLHQHGKGPLSKGEVKQVQYNLGPKFSRSPILRTNSEKCFRLDVSAYGPMLCVAKAVVKGVAKPVRLERYINFENTD